MANELVYTNYNGKTRWVIRMEEQAECPDPSSTSGQFSIDNPIVLNREYSVSSLLYHESEDLGAGLSIHDKVYIANQGVVFGSPDRSLCQQYNVGHSSIVSDGSDDSIVFTNYTAASDTTISFWIFPTSVSGNNKYALSAYSGTNGSVNWSVLRDGASWKFVGSGSTQQDALATVDLDTWQHIAVVFDAVGANISFYKNGVKTADSGSIDVSGSTGSFNIFGYSTNGTSIAASSGFAGHMSGLKFHSSVLLADEIYALANSAYDVDATSNFAIGTGEQYLSSSSLTLDVLGGTGNYCIREEYDGGTSQDVGSLLNYSLEVVVDAGGVSPTYPYLGLDYINNFPS
jgi:hypothetical protein